MGAFPGEGALPDIHRKSPGRAPARQLCSTSDEAREWIEDQAAALGLPIKWVDSTQMADRSARGSQHFEDALSSR